jgi:hypothetical protein
VGRGSTGEDMWGLLGNDSQGQNDLHLKAQVAP